jgi:hypothetical protein
VEDVAAGNLHRLANARLCPLMREGQERYELAAEVVDLGRGEPHVAGNQLGTDLPGAARPPKQGLPHEDQDIVGDIGATRSQPEQGVGVKGAGASGTLSQRLVGDEGSEHGEDLLSPCLLNEKAPATGAGARFRSEAHNGGLRKENGGQSLPGQSSETVTQCHQGPGWAVRIVFFRPSRSKSFSI